MVRSPIDDYLEEQGRLDTPVARFARRADEGAVALADYADLIPLTAPGPGEQYAFQVDLDACTGCKACVAACHSLNGLDEGETWRDVGLLVNQEDDEAFLQSVTTACHHCADPGCLNGCPVLAYEKDPATGIVRHLDDQCIGCSYCILMCPYDVPKFNARRGIVRKCDMCHGRLAQGEAPACVQACPTEAIRIVTVAVRREAGRPVVAEPAFLSAAPDPSLTQPTTRYLSRNPLPQGLGAPDACVPRLQPGHAPLVVMLTLLEAAVGASVGAALAGAAGTRVAGLAGGALLAPRLSVLAAGLGGAGLAASVLHLGRPERAWRIFLGIRRSWLSREALVFGAWAGAAFACAGAVILDRPCPAGLAAAAAVLGVAGLCCSAMIYVATGRRHWRAAETFPRILGASLSLGLAGATAAGWRSAGGAAALAIVVFFRILSELRVTRELGDADDPPSRARLTARLLDGPLRRIAGSRALAAAAGTLLGLAVVLGRAGGCWGWVALGCILAGEGAERWLCFRAVDAPGMPGVGLGGGHP